MSVRLYCGLGFLLFLCTAVNSQDEVTSTTASPEVLNVPYCFHFTWLGPKYTAESNFKNVTCEQILDGAKNVPCVQPLVVTNNSHIPDTQYMWDEYKSKPTDIACRLSSGDKCVKYTYKYNNAYVNITYTCAKVNIENEGVAPSACYTEFQNGREIEVCVCESSANSMPCNSSPHYLGAKSIQTLIGIISVSLIKIIFPYII